MKRATTHRGLLIAGLLATLVATPLAAQSAVTTYSPGNIQWEALSFRASRMGVRADSEIKLSVHPTAEVASSLISPSSGTKVEASSDQVVRVVIESTVRGRTSVMDLALDPASAAAYQRSLLAERRDEMLFRIFRYMRDGVFVRRHEAAPNAKGDPSGWPVTNERTLPYPGGLGSDPVTEAGALFYMLAAGDFRQVGDHLTFINFDRDGMSKVKLKVEEMTTVGVDYTEVSPRGERRVRADHRVARLTVSGETVGEGEDAFSFLGLTGDIEIFADPELRAPIAVRGRVPRAGRTMVQLRRMVVK